MTIPASAAIVAFPDIVVTAIGQSGIQTGVRTDMDLGEFNVMDSPMGFLAGDQIIVTIRAADDMRFRLEAGSEATFYLTFGSPQLNGLLTPLSSFEITFDNLSGGSIPEFNMYNRTVTPNPSALTGGLAFYNLEPIEIPDTVTFDSITLSGIAAASMDARFLTDDRFPFSSVPTEFRFYSNNFGMSLVPVPEPSTAAIAGLAGVLALFRRRNTNQPHSGIGR